jgi:MFS family permease
MRVDRNLNLVWLFTACTNTLFIIPVVVPYYMEQIGLGYREFLFGEAAFAASIVLFDVPTGWISDVWRRKHTLMLGTVVWMAGLGCLLIARSLWYVILAQGLTGVGYSLLSGTNTALIYDTLLSAGRESEYRRLEGKRLAISLYAVAGASVVGGFFYSISPRLPIALSIVTQFIALITASLMDEPERHKRSAEKHPIIDIAETVKYALHGHAEIGFIIIFAATMFCSTKLIMWSQQPYYIALELPKSAFGILMAVGYGLGGLSSHWAHMLDGKVDTFRALMLAWLIAFLVCIGAAGMMGLPGIGLLMIGGSCIYGATSPRVNEAINRLVGSERRATILSTQSLMTNLLAIPLSSVTGWISGLWGVRGTLYAIALWLCLAGFCLGGWAIRRKRAASGLSAEA